MSWKRQLFLFHRWAGIVLCLFFALWFVSGIFMMYVPFPELTQRERAAGSQPLDFATATLTAAEALVNLAPEDFTRKATASAMESIDPTTTARSAGLSSASDPASRRVTAGIVPRSLRAAMISGRPAYVVHAENGAQPRVVFADTGEVLREVTPAMGEAAVAAFAARSGWRSSREGPTFLARMQTDQWSVSGALNDHRPLLQYRLNDADGGVLYVSSTTGEVVRDTRSNERLLNYFGAVVHWIYPTVIRKYPLLWEWIVDVLAAAGTVLAITGLWIGVLRWNRRAEPGKPQVPYSGLMRWHYFTGVTFGVVSVTWVFSGLLSMNPFGINPSPRARDDQQLVFSGKPLTAVDFILPETGWGAQAVEASLVHYRGQPFYRVLDADGQIRMVAGAPSAVAQPTAAQIIAAAPQLLPDASVVSARVMTSYDDYYYSRRPEEGGRPLPIVRVRFDDAARTWFHIDPLTGQIVERSTHTNRVYRWLYNGLHSFDLWWLWQRRPLWDICVIALSLGGFILSMIGVVIGWRRLRYRAARRASANFTASSSVRV